MEFVTKLFNLISNFYVYFTFGYILSLFIYAIASNDLTHLVANTH